MGATVVLEDTSLEVVPGEELRVPAVITNTGQRVDAFRLDVAGVPDGWSRVEPPDVRLLPGKRTEATVVLTLPRLSSTLTGVRVIGLRARSDEDPDGSCVEEAVLEVLPFADLSAELVPRTRMARGLGTARYVIAVDNRGNAPATIELDAFDPDQQLVLAVGASPLVCAPGSATFGDLFVRGEHRYWRGPPLTRGFTALVREPGQEALELEGNLVHLGVLPQSLPRTLGRLLGLIALAVLAFLLLLRPAIENAAEDAARDAAEEAVRPVDAKVTDAAADANAAQEAAQAASEAVAAAAPAAAPPAPGPVVTGPDLGPRPFTRRLSVRAGDYGPFLRVADDQQVTLEGFVVQPNGDRGEAAVLRSGEVLVTLRLGAAQVLTLPAPVVFPPGSTIQFTVLCRNPEGVPCDAAVLLNGTVQTVVGATPVPQRTAAAPAAQPQPAPRAEPPPSPSPQPGG